MKENPKKITGLHYQVRMGHVVLSYLVNACTGSEAIVVKFLCNYKFNLDHMKESYADYLTIQSNSMLYTKANEYNWSNHCINESNCTT